MLATLEIAAGNHTRRECPVLAPLRDSALASIPQEQLDRLLLCEVVANQERPYPWAQVFSARDGTLALGMVLDYLPAGATRTFHLCRTDKPVEWKHCGVEVEPAAGDRLRVSVLGTDFTWYNHGSEHARPNLYPVAGPYGASVTWSGPPDHVHHRSLWVAHGEVNGVDNWSEHKDHGKTVTESIEAAFGGPALGAIRARNSWVSAVGQKVLEESVEYLFYALSFERRIIDVNLELTASEGDVRFGDTKEGGTLSIRVAQSLEVEEGGTITNSYGGINEKETWGKRAQWCDYSGLLEGRRVGIAAFDHPANFRHPVWWHVRNYGLMTANLFGLSHFTGDPTQRGDYTLPQGQSLRLRYRVLVHSGDVREANVAEAYHDFANPPSVAVTSA